MSLRPLELCEALEEEHAALYGHEDWRVLASEITDPGSMLADVTAVFGPDPLPPLPPNPSAQQLQIRIADRLNRIIDSPLLLAVDERVREKLPESVAACLAVDPPGDADGVRHRNRDTINALFKVRGIERRTWLYEANQIVDARELAQRWKRLFGDQEEWLRSDDDPAERLSEIVQSLNDLVAGELLTKRIPQISADPNLSPDTRTIINDTENRLPEAEVAYLNRRILDDLFGDYVERGRDARLEKLFESIHANGNTSALCLSGGGIRSATFALGVLQSLARRNLLDKFDYISTVSGGGYIGSWLSSWCRRHPAGVRGVCADLAERRTDNLAPDPPPVKHLREYSNYLTPRMGALSGDTLAVISIYLRNLFLNWVMLVPLLLAALLVPRAVSALYFRDIAADAAGLFGNLAERTRWHWLEPVLLGDASFFQQGWGETTLFTCGMIALSVAFLYYGFARPASNKYRSGFAQRMERWLAKLGTGPLVIGSVFLAASWVKCPANSLTMKPFWIFAVAPLVSGFVYLMKYVFTADADRREVAHVTRPRASRFFVELVGVLIAGATGGGVIWLATQHLFPQRLHAMSLGTFPSPVLAFAEAAPSLALYVVFSVPILVGTLFLSAAVFVGISSQVNEDYDREWWARCGGSALGAVIVWVLVTGIVVFGPVGIHFAPKAIAAAGGISGVLAFILARRKKPPTSSASARTIGEMLGDHALAIAAPLFVAVVLAFLSLLTSRFFAPPAPVTPGTAAVLEKLKWQAKETVPSTSIAGSVETVTSTPERPVIDVARLAAWNHLRSFETTPLMDVLGSILVLMFVSAVASWFVNVNKFSMHSMYRNRLIRAYLGASRLHRDPNPITGFDPQDNLPMHVLRAELLWTGSFRDAEQFFVELDTKDEPFIVRLREEVYQRERRRALRKARRSEDFGGQLAQVINDVLENVDLSVPAAPSRSFMREAIGLLSAGWRFVNRLGRWGRNMVVQRAWIPWAEEKRREEPAAPRLGFAVLRKNRERLDDAFPRWLYPYDFPLLQPADVRDVSALRNLVRRRGDGPLSFGNRLWTTLRANAMLLEGCNPENSHYRRAVNNVVRALNQVLEKYDLEDETADSFGEVAKYPPSSTLVGRNRRRLDAELSEAIHPLRAPRPMHVMNMALNLVQGENLAWQERKAESFTVSPMHAGSNRLGYRETSEYGGAGGMTVGTAMAVSGAAISPNRGQKTSSALAFLMTLFNVRLGWWFGNPGARGQKTWRHEGPLPATRPLLEEASGDTTDRSRYVYLSDGGHFENLGLYEMVLRRRHFIVISDAGYDHGYAFDDLGNAIRKIRTDLGIPIDIERLSIYPRDAAKDGGKYCAIGRIRYTAVDPTGKDGQLLYIKPAVYLRNEPTDVYNYARSSMQFPQESTVDQWFSESQFESYRMLGVYIMEQICTSGKAMSFANDCEAAAARNWSPRSMLEFFKRASEYLEPQSAVTELNSAVSQISSRFLELFQETPLPMSVAATAPRRRSWWFRSPRA